MYEHHYIKYTIRNCFHNGQAIGVKSLNMNDELFLMLYHERFITVYALSIQWHASLI